MTTYTYNEAIDGALKYFNGDQLAANVWVTKYCLKTKKDESDDSEEYLYFEQSPVEMFHRLISEIHRAGQKYENPLTYEELYEVLVDFKYIVLQGRPMAGIGNFFQISSLSNCFAIGYP
ncbi:hypothetical protein EZS27_038146 [termite gut metagenome]|uniref:Uncharacterized protein n=1 Tax=termite gut metagenome TaxID=433724 RepID=A0A5J4PN22_9ZZZZ